MAVDPNLLYKSGTVSQREFRSCGSYVNKIMSFRFSSVIKMVNGQRCLVCVSEVTQNQVADGLTDSME